MGMKRYLFCSILELELELELVGLQHPKPASGPGVLEETVHVGYQAVRCYAISARLEAFGSFVSC